MPTWLRVEAGSSPRSRSSALARIERLHAASGSSARGQRSAAHDLDRLQAARVDREQLVHGAPAYGGPSSFVAVVAIAAVAGGDRLVVGDVAGRLLEVGGEPAALQDLGEDVRDPLAGNVRASHLGDRVVAVAHEHPLVEARGALALDSVERPLATRDIAGELLEEEPPEGARVSGVTREQGPLDGLRQVDEAEDGPVQVGEMRPKDGLLLGGEGLDGVAHGCES